MQSIKTNNGYSYSNFIELFISEIVHTEDSFCKFYTIKPTLQQTPFSLVHLYVNIMPPTSHFYYALYVV